ncbi:MAG: molybdopterin-dependent oxidoreductase [Acidobacteriota bacterium]
MERMPAVHSVCPLDCPDRCSLEVRVEDGRVSAIAGSRVHPLTDGFICAKVRRFARRVYGPERLRHPMRRVGAKGEGRFERITWDEALDRIARQMREARREHGGESILPYSYGGSNGMISQGTADERLFRSLGTSRLLRTVCAAPSAAAAEALYGRMPGIDLPDFAAARFIIVWGANPRHSHIHLMPHLKAAREAGARIALIDPRRVMSESWIDMHLPVYPGSDGAVALAMIAHLERIGRVDRAFLGCHAVGWERLLGRAREWPLERAAARARVEPRDIAAVAEAYAAADPAAIRCGWGLERNRNGESSVAAVLALPAVAGKFGVRGGGYALSTSAGYAIDDDRLAGAPEPPTRAIDMVRIGRALLEERHPPIRVLFVYNSNLVVTTPDQNRILRGLAREDLFTVVFDQVMTDTARYADVLLPATTFLEHTDLDTSYGTYAVMLAEPVIDPVGEARPNEAVFRLLCRRLGIEDAGPEGDDLLEEVLDAIGGPLACGGRAGEGAPGRGSRRLARLRRERILRFDFPGDRPVQFATVFPATPGRRVRLWPDGLGPDPYVVREDPDPSGASLALISPATDRTISSTLGELVAGRATLQMHPEDAAERDLRDGEEVRVHNRLGEVRVPLRLNSALRPGVVYLPKGIWNRHTGNGSASTAVIPDAVTAVSGGACFNDARVEVAPASRACRRGER